MSVFRKARQKQRVQKSQEVDTAYIKEINEVGEKYGRGIVAFLQVTENGVTPALKVVVAESKKGE